MIIEFAGVPRSGKTTTLDAVKDYFMRKRFNVKPVSEGAGVCPFPNYHRVSTAFWVSNRALNNVIEVITLNKNGVLYFQDRGLLDAMAFLMLLELDGILEKGDTLPAGKFSYKESLHNYLNHLASWGQFVNIVFLFEIEPTIAIERDMARKMNAGPGVITNIETLNKLQTAYSLVLEKYGSKFPRIEIIKSSSDDPVKTAIQVTKVIEDMQG